MSRPLQLRVARKWMAAADVAAFDLIPEGSELPPFRPGDHLEIEIAPGLVRHYSICNGPAQKNEYVIGVKLDPASRGGSRAMHDSVKVGDVLSTSLPKNNFPLEPSGEHPVFIAGGIGITPILSMARHLQAAKRSFALHYFSRSETHAAFLSDMASEFGASVTLHAGLDARATTERVALILQGVQAGRVVFTCGPAPLMSVVRDSASSLGLPPTTVRFEHFGAPVATSESQDAPFVVRLARSGRTVVVQPDETIVDRLQTVGVCVETSCLQGVCGTCLTPVLAGAPDHRDVYLSDAEKAAGKLILPCVSRARSDELTLDL